MSFIYDLKKELMGIGLNFENKFIKSAQESDGRIAPLALKFIDNLESSLKDLYVKDLTNLETYLRYCLDHKIEVDSKQLVYRYDNTNNVWNNGVNVNFDVLSDDVKKLYSEYKSYFMVYKDGLVKNLNELLKKAQDNGNKVAQAMLGKLISEANSALSLTFKLTPVTEAAGGGDVPEAHPDSKKDGGSDGNQAGQSNKHTDQSTAKGEMRDSIKKALSGVNPLASVLDLGIIKRFFQVMKDWTSDPEHKKRFIKMYAEVLGAEENDPVVTQRVQSIVDIATNGNNYVDDLLSRFVAKQRIQVQDVVGNSGNTSVENFQNAVLKPGQNTNSHVVNATQLLIYTIQRVISLEEEILPNDEFVNQQNQIAQGWLIELGKLLTSAQIASRNDTNKIR